MTKKTAATIAAFGLTLLIVPNFIMGALSEGGTATSGAMEIILGITSLLGAVSYVVGLCLVARSKGRHWTWGLTGLLCVVGGVVVLLLKTK